MFFNMSEIKETSDYGNVVDAELVLNRIKEFLKRESIIFTRDYTYEECIKLDKAEEILWSIRSIIKD